MYEMQRPRPVSRCRPADFSARVAPLDHLPGPGTRPSVPVDQITGWLGAPRAVAQALLFANKPGFPPSQVAHKHFLSRRLRAFFSPNDRGFPQAKRLKFSLRRVAQSFLLITQLGVSPPPHNLKFSLRLAQIFLLRIRLGVSPPPHTLKLSLRRWPEDPPCGFPSCQVAPGFPRDQGSQSLPDTGWPGVSPAPWLGVSSLPVAPDFSLPEGPKLSFAGGSGFPLRRLPSLVVRKFLRPSGETAQEVSGSNFKILWPSTSHPQLTPGCPPRRTFLHRILHRMIHRRAGAAISQVPGSGRRT